MPPAFIGYCTVRPAPPPLLRYWNALGAIALSILLASCAEEASEPAKLPESGPIFQLAAASDEYQWGDTVTNPGRIASIPDAPAAGDWPGFRGPDRDGRAAGVAFGTDWSTNPPKELWRRRVGTARSSFAVVGDYAFTQEQRGPNELVVCYDADTGEEVWINSVQERFTHIQGDGPRATPTFAGGRLFTQGAKGTLQCLDAASGSVVWKQNLQRATGAKIPHFGYSSSPLVVDDLVIEFAGGPDGKGLAAFAADTGDVAWTAGQASVTYSSPHRVRFGKTEQILLISRFGIEAFAPANGAVLWNHAWPPEKFARCIQPVIADDQTVIFGTPPRVATRALHIEHSGEAWTCEEAWTRDGFAPYFNDIIYYEGFCYGSHRKNLECIDAATGEQQWRERVFGGQMVLLPEMNAILSITEKGRVMVFSATPNGFEERAAMPDVLAGETLNHPVIAHGKLFVRNEDEAICYALPGWVASSSR